MEVHKREIPPIQLGAPYQLDRIDQRALPLDDRFSSPATGEGVQIYMIDTGVRATHVDLEGRVIAGVDVVGNDESGSPSSPTSDCDGHGTHTAATAAGTTFGVAKKATVIAVRVLNCDGDGDVDEYFEHRNCEHVWGDADGDGFEECQICGLLRSQTE